MLHLVLHYSDDGFQILTLGEDGLLDLLCVLLNKAKLSRHVLINLQRRLLNNPPHPPHPPQMGIKQMPCKLSLSLGSLCQGL